MSETRQRAKGSILVRLLPEERKALETNAREAGLSLAAYLRASALGTPGPRAKRSPTVEAELLGHAMAALNQAGGKLSDMREDSPAFYAALAEIRSAAAAIRELVGRTNK